METQISQENETPLDALHAAIDAAGKSQKKLAIKAGVKPQAVTGWLKAGQVGYRSVLQVEAASGVSRHRLRPDLYPVTAQTE